jgi:Xaa-Pro aminopeptidase
LKINKGDFVQVDFGALYRHYSSDLNRMALVGRKPTQSEKDHWNVYVEANRAGTRAVKAGVTAADIFSAMAQVFEQSGLKYPGFRAGHGLGLDAHEPPHLGASDKTVVKNGMVFAIEPFGVPNKDGIKMNCEDDVVCTESGPEKLTTIKQEIFTV